MLFFYSAKGGKGLATRKERDQEWLKRKLEYHKGKWLTMDAVHEYQKKAKELEGTDGQMTGERFRLCRQMMDEYGVTEIEAINILNGYHTADYVNKYHRIRYQIPLSIKENTSLKNDDEEA